MCPIQFQSFLVLLDPPDGKFQSKIKSNGDKASTCMFRRNLLQPPLGQKRRSQTIIRKVRNRYHFDILRNPGDCKLNSLFTVCYCGLNKYLQSRYLSRSTNCKLYKTLIRSVLLFRSESWTVNQDNAERLKIVEPQILREMYGPVKGGGIWRIRYNNELYKLYN
jgi:hypothetical protein